MPPSPTVDPVDPKVRLGENHPFDSAQLRRGFEIVQSEHRLKRLLLAVSMGHREWSRRQTLVIQLFGLGLLIAIVLTELNRPSVPRESLILWGKLSAIIFAVRSCLFYMTFRVTPEQMARSHLVRTYPLIVAALGFPLWGGTCWLFVSHGLTPTVLVIFAGFAVLSVPTAALWSSVPMAVVTWVAAGWGSFIWFAASGGVLPWPILALLFFSIVGTFYAVIILQMREIGGLLDRSDRVDLLVNCLSESNQQLLAANAKLDTLKQEAERVLAARSTFFATASHDLKQRLHAAKLLVNIQVARHAGGPEVNPLRQLADTIEDVERLSAQALEFARFERIFESVQTPHERAAVPLQKVFQELAVSLDATAELRKVDLRFRVSDAIVIVDRHLLVRIIENLVHNALRFSRDRVLVASRRRGAGLTIQVWDRGPGIDPSALQRIFEPFFQGSTTGAGQAASHCGYGLGLATVRRFSEVLGMTVSVRSRAGHGSVFEIHVPPELVQLHPKDSSAL